MKIEMLVKIEGSRNGQRWPEVGAVIDLPEGEALDLIATRCAKKADKGAKPEAALTPPAPERATARKAATRRKP